LFSLVYGYLTNCDHWELMELVIRQRSESVYGVCGSSSNLTQEVQDKQTPQGEGG